MRAPLSSSLSFPSLLTYPRRDQNSKLEVVHSNLPLRKRKLSIMASPLWCITAISLANRKTMGINMEKKRKNCASANSHAHSYVDHQQDGARSRCVDRCTHMLHEQATAITYAKAHTCAYRSPERNSQEELNGDAGCMSVVHLPSSTAYLILSSDVLGSECVYVRARTSKWWLCT